VLSMDRNGVIRINQEEIELKRLVERLQDIFKSRSDRTMFFQADKELLFNDVAQLIDAAKGAGVERLGQPYRQHGGAVRSLAYQRGLPGGSRY